MAISTCLSWLHPLRPQLLFSPSPVTTHRFISAFSPPTFLQTQTPTRIKSSWPRRSSGAILPQKHLRAEDLKEELISAIGEELSSLEMGSVESLHEALRLVDLIQGLGIQRFFKSQIETILRSAYAQWDEKYGFFDVDITTLAFRLLRLHGYHVHGDVLKVLRDKGDGNFSAFSIRTSEQISGLLNLYKCSQIGFPEEAQVMDEAQDFSSTQLANILLDLDLSRLLDDTQRKEIEFALAFPHQCHLSRMEARSIARRLWPSSGLSSKCLELACLDLEMLQKVYQQEMDELERWLDKQGFEEFSFCRQHVLKCFIVMAMSLFEHQFSFYRVSFAKISFLATVLDDLFDPPLSNYQELSQFQEAFQRWDVSPVENIALHKKVFKSFQQTLTETATAASKAQGHNVFPYIKEVWQDVVDAYYKEAEWTLSGYCPSFEEYLPVGTISSNAIADITTHIFFLGEPVTDEALKLIGKDSCILYLAGVVTRLVNDIATVEREMEMEGKLCNAVGCYMKDHPECTKEDAVAVIKEMIKTSLREMEQEMFKCRGVVSDIFIEAVHCFAQAVCVTYAKLDAYKCTTDAEYEELVKDYIGY